MEEAEFHVAYGNEPGRPIAWFITKTDATMFAHMLNRREGVEFVVGPVGK